MIGYSLKENAELLMHQHQEDMDNIVGLLKEMAESGDPRLPRPLMDASCSQDFAKMAKLVSKAAKTGSLSQKDVPALQKGIEVLDLLKAERADAMQRTQAELARIDREEAKGSAQVEYRAELVEDQQMLLEDVGTLIQMRSFLAAMEQQTAQAPVSDIARKQVNKTKAAQKGTPGLY